MPRDIMLLILAVFMTQGLARGVIVRDDLPSEFTKVIIYDSAQTDFG